MRPKNFFSYNRFNGKKINSLKLSPFGKANAFFIKDMSGNQ